jgi:TolB protein
VPTAGGRPEELTTKGFSGAQYPSFSPDGKSIVFVGMSEVRNKKTKDFDAVYATMSVAVLDLQTGVAKSIVSRKNVLLDAGYVYSHPSFSPDNRLIAFQQSGSDVSGGFSVIDLSGKTVFHYPKSGSDSTPFWRPQFSPDGKQILCFSPATSEDAVDSIFMINMNTGLKQRIAEGANPLFVENGKAIVFERWLNKWSSEGNAKSDLWYLEIREGAQMKKILDGASQPG